MPFPEGASKNTQFKPGKSGNLLGKPAGTRNRSTVIKEVFEMIGMLPEDMYAALKNIFPDIEQRMSFEKMCTLAQVAQAVKGDTAAYKAVLDSAYGAPKQEIDQTIRSEQPIFKDDTGS